MRNNFVQFVKKECVFVQLNNRNRYSAAFLTLGCKVNYYETERIIEQFREKGFEIKEFSEKADIYIINTCTVTNIADRKSRQMLHRAKKRNPDSLVVALGCYVDSAGEKILEDEAVDAAFFNRDKATAAEQIIKKFGLTQKRQESPIELPMGRTRAYLKIQDGCNQFCSYCLIPYVRGGVLIDTPEEEVIRQAGKLAARGYKEIVLTGIHLSSYGVAESGEKNFVKLEGRPLLNIIKKTASVPGIERIRLGSLEPRIISDDFLQGLAGIKKLCPHFHLSLQSGCDTVLRRMNRHYTTEEYREKAALLRKYFDNPSLTTDVIVGFPGETEEEFARTREYLSGLALSDMHVFKYSPREGTKAARMENPVLPEIKNRRSDILIGDNEKNRRAYAQAFLGKQQNVLFEEYVTADGERYLAGFNERYVKIGVAAREAEESGFNRNEIRRVNVKKILL